jgi:hypothetical protein
MPLPAVLPIIVETILVSLGLMGVEAAVGAAKAASAAGKTPAEIAAAAAAAAPEAKIGAGAVKRAAAEGQRVRTQSRIHTEVAEGQAAKAAAAEAAASKRWFGRGGRVGRLAGGGLTALFALSMLPMVMEMFKGRGEEGGAMPGGEGAAGEQDLLALLGAMQGGGMGGGSDFDLRELYQRSGSAADLATRRQLISSMPSSLGNRRADLDEIIRGNRDMLGQIAYSEPMSIAQAYARQGLYGGPQQPQVNFQDLM